MSDYLQTTNMNLTVPIEGVTLGPNWALELNASLVTLDSHDHSQGKGLAITPAGMNINADLPFGNNNLTLVRTLRFQAPNSQPGGSADLTCLYAFGVDLYYRDGSGNQVRITQGGGVTGAAGNITNLSSPASVTYVAGTTTFVFQSAASTPANIDGASLVLRNLSANSKGLTLSPPAAMAADYSLTLPALPGAASVVTIAADGTMSPATPNATITIGGGVISVGVIGQSNVVGGFGFIPTGGVIPYGGGSAPSGYLLCDGASYLQSAYANLFATIGTSFGSADATHFNVPDMRGYFPRGAVPSALQSIVGSGSVTSNHATFTAHGLNRTGIVVQLASGALTGLSGSTSYWAVVVDANTLGFAASLSDAIAGTLISISGTNTAVLKQWEDQGASSRQALTVGGNTGAAVGSQQVADPGSHFHTINGTGVGAGSGGGASLSTITDSNGQSFFPNTGPTGTNETRALNLAFNFIIKT